MWYVTLMQISTEILLADYNDANRAISYKSLERSGYSVTAAKNGAHALGILQRQKFDLILMDILMPIMDGIKALRILRRQDGPNKATPAFALSAYSSPEDRERYLLAGFDAIMSKPLKSGDLEAVFAGIKKNNRGQLMDTDEKPALTNTSLLDNEIIQQIIARSDRPPLKLVQIRFWMSVKEQCKIIEQSLPNALNADRTDLSKFRRAVHTIKHASEAIGLSRVADISRHLQNAPPSQIPPLLRAFADALAESRSALAEVLIRPRELNIPMQVSGQDEAKAPHNRHNNRAAIWN